MALLSLKRGHNVLRSESLEIRGAGLNSVPLGRMDVETLVCLRTEVVIPNSLGLDGLSSLGNSGADLLIIDD
jgi:hypothetical protein